MTSSAPISPITEDDIADFLVNNPGFFERHADVLAGVQFSNPHSGRAVSLPERQAELLREKIKQLEHRVMDMVRNGTENAAIDHKVDLWAHDLLGIKDPLALEQAVVQGLAARFQVPQVALRVWDLAPPYAPSGIVQGVGDEVRALASSLSKPMCGASLSLEPARWLEGGAQSLALLPLRDARGGGAAADGPAFGLLVLGSPDPHRFEAHMATDTLARIAGLAAAALARLR